MFVSTSGTSTKSPVSCYLDNNRGQFKRENKLACQNINQKQEELVVKETVQDHKMEVVLWPRLTQERIAVCRKH